VTGPAIRAEEAAIAEGANEAEVDAEVEEKIIHG